jgi:ribosomal protein S12 methylthiotransferase
VRTKFQDLCEALGELGIWVRLHYVYPYPHVDHVLPLMAEQKLLPYLDIPFQHASRSVLKAMRRPAAAENTLARIQAWREQVPNLAIRSTFITGFPGETEADFQELLDWLEAARLDRVGCFTYSPVDGAVANALPDHVPAELAEERRARFMELQARISAERLAERVGGREIVLVDEIDAESGLVVARSTADAPEIDGVVKLPLLDWELTPGDLIEVELLESDSHDLYARIPTEE